MTERKYNALREALQEMGSTAVAFSGGVDSAFLLKAAHEVLGENVCAVTVRSCVSTQKELGEAEKFCRDAGIPFFMINAGLYEVDGFANNPPDRCYHCKKRLMSLVISVACEKGFSHISEGSNADDDAGDRPGFAAVRELGVHSPLRDAGLTKDEIRALSHKMGLPTWDKPAFACLASRIPYGETITEEKLRMVERAEESLFGMGLKQVRVRCHQTGLSHTARIETDGAGFTIAASRREEVHRLLKEAGFGYVSLDLGGYRTGSLNGTRMKGGSG